MRGKATKKYRVEVDAITGEEVKRVAEEDGRHNNRGSSAERMRELTKIRMEKIKNGELKSGPPRRPTREEAVNRALERLEPVALKVLEKQLKDENLDPSDRRAAAIKIIEYRRGKPTQALKVDSQQVSTIRFETAAWIPGMENASSASLETGEILELEAGEEPDDDASEE